MFLQSTLEGLVKLLPHRQKVLLSVWFMLWFICCNRNVGSTSGVSSGTHCILFIQATAQMYFPDKTFLSVFWYSEIPRPGINFRMCGFNLKCGNVHESSMSLCV